MNPNVLDKPTFFELDEGLMEGFGGFPGNVFLIQVGEGKFAANNATTPDGQNINGLACFPTEIAATLYQGMLSGLSGEIVTKTFEEARGIAVSKPILHCLMLFVDGKIVDIHWVR